MIWINFKETIRGRRLYAVKRIASRNLGLRSSTKVRLKTNNMPDQVQVLEARARQCIALADGAPSAQVRQMWLKMARTWAALSESQARTTDLISRQKAFAKT
jgi:hypothetical protein